MQLETLDWGIISAFFALSLGIGFWASRTAGKSAAEFFLSGRNMPWWLLGISMVATTFAADTPNLVTELVRKEGIAGNWTWWAFLITSLFTVFIYARLWRKTGIATDLEFYEMRYSGKAASFLRGFRAIYLGVFFNIVIMATVSLAAIKIGGVILGLQPWETLLIASVVTLVYSTLGGLKGVLYTDFFQFIIAMVGSVWACIYLLNLPEVGGVENLVQTLQPEGKTNIFPDFTNSAVYLPLFVIPLAVQWWSAWYPGAEPGGGGYIAQRMLSAKNQKHATAATLFFTFAHYALRPWPWILIGLASLMVFPELADIQEAFPHLDASEIKDDIAYPAMISKLPVGLSGLVIASLIAAYMSTISTHLNWGSSYVVNDVFKRFVNPKASEKKQVALGRWTTAILLFISSLLALALESAVDGFMLIVKIGAGTGLIFFLRWFWRRINAITEIVAMMASFFIALALHFLNTGLEEWEEYIALVVLSSIVWLTASYLTPITTDEKWQSFKKATAEKIPWKWAVISIVAGLVAIYGTLFTVGWWVMGTSSAIYSGVLSLVAMGVLVVGWRKLF